MMVELRTKNIYFDVRGIIMIRVKASNEEMQLKKIIVVYYDPENLKRKEDQLILRTPPNSKSENEK